MVEVCISNAFIFHKHYIPRSSKVHLDYKSYWLKLAETLIGNYNSRKKYSLPYEIYEKATTGTPTRKRRVSDRSLDSRPSHFPIKGRKGRCIYCRDVHGVRHESSVRCDECDVALCIDSNHGRDSCFKLYHIY